MNLPRREPQGGPNQHGPAPSQSTSNYVAVSTTGPYSCRRGRGGSFFSAQRFFIISEIRRFVAALNRRRRRKIGLLRLPLLDGELRMAIACSNRSFSASSTSIIRRISMYEILRYTTDSSLPQPHHASSIICPRLPGDCINLENPSFGIPV